MDTAPFSLPCDIGAFSPRSAWTELKANGIRPKARYGHSMCRMDTRVLMFGGENNTNLANDLWTLRGLGLDGEESPSWLPLELPGTAPAPRKGHACASKLFEQRINLSNSAVINCSLPAGIHWCVSHWAVCK